MITFDIVYRVRSSTGCFLYKGTSFSSSQSNWSERGLLSCLTVNASDTGGDLESRQQKTRRMEQQYDCAGTYQKCEHGNPNKVAFFVGLEKNFGPVSQRKDIIFDGVVTNIGSGYSQCTGRFTAPVSGTYQFNVNVAAVHNQTACVFTVKNGVPITEHGTWSCNKTAYWSPSSSVAILSLERGDQVWLQLEGGGEFSLYQGMQTTFSGYLIFKNC